MVTVNIGVHSRCCNALPLLTPNVAGLNVFLVCCFLYNVVMLPQSYNDIQKQSSCTRHVQTVHSVILHMATCTDYTHNSVTYIKYMYMDSPTYIIKTDILRMLG